MTIASEYQSGASLSALGVARGVCLQTIRHILRRRGVPRRRRGGLIRGFSPEVVNDMAARWGLGESQHAIGRKYGVGQTIVSRVLKLNGIQPTRRLATRERHASWKGGVTYSSHGYRLIYVPLDSPFVSMRNVEGYALEHRLVMAQRLGRPLTARESVHHINGDRLDNRPENLQLRQRLQHGTGQAMECGDCGSHNIVAVPLADEVA